MLFLSVSAVQLVGKTLSHHKACISLPWAVKVCYHLANKWQLLLIRHLTSKQQPLGSLLVLLSNLQLNFIIVNRQQTTRPIWAVRTMEVPGKWRCPDNRSPDKGGSTVLQYLLA